MNQDPNVNHWRELAWRRSLTATEAGAFREWLARHPEAETALVGEPELTRLLARLPGAPVPSNFTARVLQQIERECLATVRPAQPPGAWWWRVFAPRAALATLLVITGLFVYQVQMTRRATQLAEKLTAVATVHAVLPRQAQEDFDTINFRVVGPAADEELLALLQ